MNTALTVNGGTVDLNNAGTSNSQTVASLSGTGGAVTNTDATTLRTLTVTQTASTSYAGALAGNLQLVMNGPGGTLALSGTSTYTGGTNLVAGEIGINSPTALGTGPFVIGAGTTIDNTSGSPLSVSTTNAQTWNGNFSFGGSADLNLGTGTVTLASSPVVTVNGGTLTVGPIVDGGTGKGLTKDGPGTLALAGASNYSGTTTVSNGTLLISGTNAGSGATNVNAGMLTVTNATGSATGSGTATIGSTAILAGNGNITGPVVLNGHLSPGVGTGGIGTLHLGATTLSTGSILDYDMAGLAAFDSAATTGLTLGSSITVNIDALPGFSLGTYNLVTSPSLTGNPTYIVNHSGLGDNGNFVYTVATVGNNIVLTVNATAQKWTGAAGNGGNGTWDTTSVNWDPAVNGGTYADGKYKQVFDDSGTNTNITINSVSGSVKPVAVQFSNNTVPYTISGQPIDGATAVVIQGPGVVNLNSPNTYTGGTTLLGGTLNMGDPSGAAIGTQTLAISGGTIDNTSGGPMFMSNNNPQIWAGSFTFAGSNVDSSHDLNIGSGGVTLTTTPTVTVAGSMSQLRIDGPIIDNGAGFGFTKDGPGTLFLNANNTYSGTATLLNGTLLVGGTLGNGTAGLTVLGGTLDLEGTNQNVGAVNVSAGTLQNGNLNATSINISNAADMAIPASFSFSGTATLTKNNTGTLTLQSTNSYSGGTTITGGVLSIASDSYLGVVPATVQPANITLNGGTLRVTTGTPANSVGGTVTISTTRGITLGASGGAISIGFTNPTLTKGSETVLVYNGVITGPGGLTIVGSLPNSGVNQANQSILDLAAPATYQGMTTINNAVAQVNDGTTGINNGAAVVNILPTGTTLNLVNNGAWNIDSAISSLTVAGLTGDSSGAIGTTNNGNAAPITLSGSGNYDFPGLIGQITVGGKTGTDARISITKTGSGTQTFDHANTYAGGTTVNNGVLTTAPGGTIGNGALAVNAADTISSVVNIGAGNNQPVTSLSGTVAGSGTARVNVAAGGTLRSTQTTATTFAGSVNLASSASANGGGTLTMSGAGGSLEIQATGSLGNNSNINVSGGTLRYNVTTGGPAVVGTGVVATVSNAAVLELAGSVAALSSGTGATSVTVVNNSTATDGLHVTGTNQQVGGVDGTGTTQVDASASLTANHIVQTALVIGGTDATHTGLVTIDASDASGNPLASSGGASRWQARLPRVLLWARAPQAGRVSLALAAPRPAPDPRRARPAWAQAAPLPCRNLRRC